MTLMEQLSAYIPYNEQEARDRALLLECLRREPDVMTRQNPLGISRPRPGSSTPRARGC